MYLFAFNPICNLLNISKWTANFLFLPRKPITACSIITSIHKILFTNYLGISNHKTFNYKLTKYF